MGIHYHALWTYQSHRNLSMRPGQRVLTDCKDCVDNYIDDCIVFLDDMQSHVRDLQHVLSKLLSAGFTL